MVGTLETKTEVKVVVSDHTAQIIALGLEALAEGIAASRRRAGNNASAAAGLAEKLLSENGVSNGDKIVHTDPGLVPAGLEETALRRAEPLFPENGVFRGGGLEAILRLRRADGH